MTRFALILAVALMPLTANAQKIGTPPPSPHLEPLVRAVIQQARPDVGTEFVPGLLLTAATSQGNTTVFMSKVTPQFDAQIRASGLGKQQLQKMFITRFAKQMCRKGQATRRFIDLGGAISFAIMDRKRHLLAGGKITKC